MHRPEVRVFSSCSNLEWVGCAFSPSGSSTFSTQRQQLHQSRQRSPIYRHREMYARSRKWWANVTYELKDTEIGARSFPFICVCFMLSTLPWIPLSSFRPTTLWCLHFCLIFLINVYRSGMIVGTHASSLGRAFANAQPGINHAVRTEERQSEAIQYSNTNSGKNSSRDFQTRQSLARIKVSRSLSATKGNGRPPSPYLSHKIYFT
jgi:hypothetical protein